jgi:hypothetical protein
MNYPNPRSSMTGLGVFAPFKVRIDNPEPFGDVTHESYIDLDATWFDEDVQIASYWALIDTPQDGLELVKVTVPVDGREQKSVKDALNGAFPGWKPVQVYRAEMMEAQF